jgi:hypothetical protein
VLSNAIAWNIQEYLEVVLRSDLNIAYRTSLNRPLERHDYGITLLHKNNACVHHAFHESHLVQKSFIVNMHVSDYNSDVICAFPQIRYTYVPTHARRCIAKT